MKSIATAVSTINVPFHGAELYVVNHNGEPYTPMKPIVEGMGMDWASQFTKLKQRFAKEGANKRGNSSRLTQSFHFFMFEPIFSPVNALNQPI